MESVENNKENKSSNLKRAALFGLLFGFFLQKGGAAKYHVLIGQLLLDDFTVIKIMGAAIFTGMIGHYFLVKKALAKEELKPFRPYANILGGIIFGIGFACAGFCPGTGAAALGQGDFEAIYYILGMILGSYIYAETSAFISEHLKKPADLGKLTLANILHITKGKAVVAFSILIAGILIATKVSL